MEIIDIFLKLSLILVSARMMAELFAHLGLPAVIGEVTAGIILGPSVFGIIGDEPIFLLLANLGILFLLFHVGLETDVGKLFAVSGQSVMVALTGVALPFLAALGACYYFFDMDAPASMFIGGTLVATSIGITLRVLKDLAKHQTRGAQIVLGAAVIDDVIGVIVLAFLIDYLRTGTVDPVSTMTILAFIAVFLFGAPFLGPIVRMSLAKLSETAKTPGVVSTIVVSMILVFSSLSHEFGAPEIIGAFAAGLALTGSPLFFNRWRKEKHLKSIVTSVEQVDKNVTPIGELFMPFFFVMVGVSMDLNAIDFGSADFWIFAGTLTALAIVTKILSGVWVKGPFSMKVLVGVAMVPRGEVGLIFAKTGLNNGVFDDTVYASIVFVVALTTIGAPLLLKPLVERFSD